MMKLLAPTFILGATAILWATTAGMFHGLTCDKGHYETVHVDDFSYLQYMPIGSNGEFIMIPQFIPAHDEQHWVCDHSK